MIELQGSVWMTMDGQNMGGAGRVELLEKIAELGSITQAAKAMKMSYKAAWDAIDHMNNTAGEPLVARMVGGKGGGSTRLTARGLQLVANFKVIVQEHRRFVDQLSQQAQGLAEDLQLIRKMSLKTSARNQFLGRVQSIQTGAVNAEVRLDLGGGVEIVAIITNESVTRLALAPGLEAYALIKAPWVILTTDDTLKTSARNRLCGTVVRCQEGAVNAEVILELTAGKTIAAIVTNTSIQSLGIREGIRACALIKASHVILAVAV
ncbi:MAG: TOBE domain-containing protein [Magnetococcales bacterium]|nr:TOBE domain-containing protein [Magnetococcales bacterium]